MPSDIRPSSWNPDPAPDGAESLTRWARVISGLALAAVTQAEALEWTLKLVCEHTGWPLGHLFLARSDGSMCSADIWYDSDPERHKSFRAASADLVIAPGQSLPGLVSDVGDTAWIPDVRTEPAYSRAAAAAASGLVSGVASPIVGSKRMEGVMEFYLHGSSQPDPELEDVLALIGLHLGTVLERARTESALARSDARFSNLVEQAPDALLAVGPEGRIHLANAEAERLTGYTRQELTGSYVDELIPGGMHDAFYALVEDNGASRRTVGADGGLSLRRRDGGCIPVEITLSPIEGPDGGLFMVAARDLTERARAAEAVRQSEARLAEAQRVAQIGSWSWVVGAPDVVWSAEARRIYGVAGGDGTIRAETAIDLLHVEDQPRARDALRRTVQTMAPLDEELRVVHPDGTIRWLRIRGDVTATVGSRAQRLTGYCQDITEHRASEDRRRQALEELAFSRGILERIARGEGLEPVLDSLCVEAERRHPGAKVMISIVDQAERSLVSGAAPSLPAGFVRLLDGLPIARGLGACGTAAALGQVVVVTDVEGDPMMEAFTSLVGRFQIRSVWSQPIKGSNDEVIGAVAVYHSDPHRPTENELTFVSSVGNLAGLAIERHLSEEALARAAQIDPLTQLPNRARFLSELEEHLAQGRRDVAVMFLDLDRFKWINDSLGHPAGDRILVEAAGRLRRLIASRSMVARFGGDEFTVLVVNATQSRVIRVAERIAEAFSEPFVLDGGEFFLSVSVGIASGGDEAYAMIRDADAAMYEAKERGRARHVWFDERLRSRALERLSAESNIRRGIERDEFVVHYQPIADLADGRWSGVEALVRWDHPADGLIGPGDFIPLAEETGLILPLGARIMERTLEQAGMLGLTQKGYGVAVNLSAVQLSDPTIAHQVRRLLTAYELTPESLTLELTESAVMEEYETAQSTLREIADLGVRLVIDDFGTGYSSISRLTSLPITGIKIDRSFTARIGSDPAVDPVLAAIVDLAHALGLSVVAEGIETTAAVELLRSLGCDSGQGFHLSPPLTTDALLAVLARPAFHPGRQE